MLAKSDFVNAVMSEVAHKPKEWRYGQAVFNYTAALYGDVARIVQFEHGVDCFYRDDEVENFLNKAYEVYCNSYQKGVGYVKSK